MNNISCVVFLPLVKGCELAETKNGCYKHLRTPQKISKSQTDDFDPYTGT